MKIFKNSFLLIYIICHCISAIAQNDSVEDKTNFIIGINGAPNNTLNIYAFGKSNGSSEKATDQKLSIGGEGEIFVGFKTKKTIVTFGVGYAYHSSKNLHQTYNGTYFNSYTKVHYTFHDELYKVSANINWLVGDKYRWIIGTNIEYGVIHYFKEFVHIENNPYAVETDFTHTYLTPQNTIWLGINFGRLFKINRFIDLNIFFNTKGSDMILGKDYSGNLYNGAITTRDRNLLVKTLNINLCFKL